MTLVHQCSCETCEEKSDNQTQQLHHQMNLLLSRLDEQQRRWYAALEAKKYGHGGAKLLAQITGLSVETIRRGRNELANGLNDRPVGRVRQVGGGRPAIEKKVQR